LELTGCGIRKGSYVANEVGVEKKLEKEISSLLERLLAIIAPCDTESVLGWCFSYHLPTSTAEKSEERLASPAKQVPFLLSLLLSTPPPKESNSLSRDQWQEVMRLLNQLFQAYMLLYMPSKDQVGALSDAWRRSREVAMMAFLHFHNTGLLASVEQIKERITRYVAPFDKEVQKAIGVSATEAIAISDWISRKLQEALDGLLDAAAKENAARQAMLAKAQQEGWPLDKIREAASKPEYFEAATAMLDGLKRLSKVRLSEVHSSFPSTAHAFLSAFSISRGDGPSMRYPTEEAIYSIRPLVHVADDTVMCISSNAIIGAVLTVTEKALLASPARDSYLRTRDNELEREALEYIKSFLDPDARFYTEVFETQDGQYEHDVVAEDSRLQIALEAKASPPREPFRDPDKAFPRIRDAFRGDTGIQKAFEQGNRIVRRLKNNESIALYDRKGTHIAELKPDPSKLPTCICVTRDNFGALATKLSLLLEKHADDAFPWAVNILDLANLSMAWRYLKWGSLEFRRYLEQRALLHEKGLADDELDFAGYFIRHGDFKVALEAKSDIFQFNPDYSSVFDDLYRHIHLGGPPVEIRQTEPVVMDLRRSLTRDEPVFLDPKSFKPLDAERSRLNKLRLREKKQKEKNKEKMRNRSKSRNRKKKGC
jgi:hypothetical protein